jgi:hypothetical protein
MFAHDPQHTGCYSTPDTTPPTVTITYPISGAIVSGDITVIASASDNIGVSNVEVYLDDITKLGEDNTAPYDIPWDTTQTGEGQHTLTAIARDIAGNTTTSQAVTVTVDNRPPAPSDLIAKASSFNQIDLTWEDNSNNELGFIIERSLDPNPTSNSWSQIAKVGTGITSYSDTNNLKPNTTYYYRLKAYNNIGESAYSNIATATTPSEAYSVSGKVYAVIRGKQLPLQGATVTLALPKAPLKVITGSDGSYQFKDIPPGTYTITATKKGYFSQLKRIKVKTNLTNVNFYLLAKPKKGRF